jgi:UDP-2,3-diacylglucosamine pyrophosphatase LpxH
MVDKLSKVISDFAGNSPVSLICVGDTLDLTLSYVETCVTEFVKLLEKLPKFHNIIYVVGNHDHHIWTMHSEYNNITSRLLKGMIPNKGGIYQNTGVRGEQFQLFEALLNGPSVILAYPMFKLPESYVYFTHGHLFGDIYTFISDVLAPFIPKDLPHVKIASTLNVAVIEFIYWLIGETGEGMGSDGIMEAIYADSQKGKKSLLNEALNSAVKVLLPNGIIKGFPDSWERSIAKWIGKNMINEYVKEPRPITALDRHMPSETSRKLAQDWINKTIDLANEKNGIKLVCGHTHISDRFVVPDKQIEIINLGGWLIDACDLSPDTNVLLIDGDKLELKKV